MNLAYRATQFLRALSAKSYALDHTLIENHLSPSLAQCFYRLSPADQRHAARVLQHLLQQGEVDPNLLSAALLHDIGKVHAQPRLMDRVLVVLADWLFPNLALKWASGKPTGLRRPFVIAGQHAGWGADILEEAGAPQTVVELVRRHHDPPPEIAQTEFDRLLKHLQRADSEN
jgi:putative nucleotidyltransferase with HDIG domain